MLTHWRLFLGLSVSMALPSLGHALTVGHIEVQSAVNEPFRAKIPLRNISVPLDSIKTQMASDNDYARLGIDPTAAPKLNFQIQDNGNGTAILWLSSNEAVNANQVDLLISVGAQQDKTLHQMSAALKPSREQLPTRMSEPVYASNETELVPVLSAPPPMSVGSSQVILPTVSESAVADQPVSTSVDVTQPDDVAQLYNTNAQPAKPVVAVTNQAVSTGVSEFEKQVVARSKAAEPQATKPDKDTVAHTEKQKKNPVQTNAKVAKRSNYRVVRRDTLWDIATRVSREHNLPLNKVMDSIQALNQDAFIRRNPNLLREGVTLTIPRYDEVNELARSFKKSSKSRSKPGSRSASHAKKSRKAALSARKARTSRKSRKKESVRKARPTRATAKKRIDKAEMRIVAQSANGKAQGEVKQSTQSVAGSKKLAPQITAQVKKSRQATIVQRKRVNKLNTKLSNYSKKIQLQNAKLAELENRLKQLNKQSKSAGSS